MLARKVLECIPRSIRVLRKLTVFALDGSLTFHQTRVLYFIKEGLGQSQIAEVFQVSPAAVSRLMRELKEKGLVRMSPGEDRRERQLKLTREGARLLGAVNRTMEKKVNKHVDALSKEEKDQLMKGLVVLDKLMGQIKEG